MTLLGLKPHQVRSPGRVIYNGRIIGIRDNLRRDSRFWTSGTRARTLALQVSKVVQVSNRENREIRVFNWVRLLLVAPHSFKKYESVEFLAVLIVGRTAAAPGGGRKISNSEDLFAVPVGVSDGVAENGSPADRYGD